MKRLPDTAPPPTRAGRQHTFAPVVDTKILLSLGLALLVAAFALASIPAAILAFAVLASAALARADKVTHDVSYRLALPADPQELVAGQARADITIAARDDQGDTLAGAQFTSVIEATYPGALPARLLVSVDGVRTLELSVPSLRTGVRELFTLTALPTSASMGWFGDWVSLGMSPTLVLAPLKPLPPIPSAAVAKGLTGPRTSVRAGEGREFRDVGLYTQNNTLRQVDWRATSRRSPELDELYVRRTFAQSEATTVIMLDSRDDVGPEIRSWGSAHASRADQKTSMDLAREAATALAQVAISKGDRVGFEDLGHPKKPVPPGTGSRHFERLRHAVSLAAPKGGPTHRVRAPLVQRDALVFVLSTFLDDASTSTISSLVARGHQVVAVDTLPRVSTWSLIDRQVIAFRLFQIARQARMRQCEKMGVSVIAWRDEDRSTKLATLERASHVRRTS